MAAEPLHLVYDARCAFCVRALRIARSLDVCRMLRFHDANDRDAVEAAFPALRGADLDDAMYAVTPRGRVYRGFFAFRRLVHSCVLWWPLLLIFYFPGAGVVGPRIYGWIARNRGNFGCHSTVPASSTPLGAETARTGGPRRGCDDHRRQLPRM